MKVRKADIKADIKKCATLREEWDYCNYNDDDNKTPSVLVISL